MFLLAKIWKQQKWSIVSLFSETSVYNWVFFLYLFCMPTKSLKESMYAFEILSP